MGILDWLFGKREPEARPELLVFGLGNPGGKYAGTRHNIGFEVIDRLCAVDTLVSPSKEICEAVCRLMMCGPGKKPVLFVKPLTYMNLSGDAVGALVRRYGLTAADCLVVVDDFNIPLGKLRFRKDGSPGGHNGLKSISAAIGSDYPRLRVGIGPLPAGISIIDFVLGRFEDSGREEVDKVIKVAADAVDFMIENGIDTAMNKYN
ncbi:MAG: aminoacyl-tRNA hydrolase [Chitinispirillia bacterium]|nr:aminoacyl-tRNA hydrolase [Chitinispirillia bacterium]MCL2241431.1 aminoacyl-tRNA hydrolase [Chitinispirillia bacterium]